MARIIGVFEGPTSLQEVFGRNVPNRRSFESYEDLLKALKEGLLDGIVIPENLVSRTFVAAQMGLIQCVRGFAYIKPSLEIRVRRARSRMHERRAWREYTPPRRLPC
ncbi:MAG: hypothetical protein HYT49_01870 [Candidatus Wildermuthbacteria bacterium]|nr:hypothetical protein [Candidatus Wildermuthbacteria bacterium]